MYNDAGNLKYVLLWNAIQAVPYEWIYTETDLFGTSFALKHLTFYTTSQFSHLSFTGSYSPSHGITFKQYLILASYENLRNCYWCPLNLYNP